MVNRWNVVRTRVQMVRSMLLLRCCTAVTQPPLSCLQTRMNRNLFDTGLEKRRIQSGTTKAKEEKEEEEKRGSCKVRYRYARRWFLGRLKKGKTVGTRRLDVSTAPGLINRGDASGVTGLACRDTSAAAALIYAAPLHRDLLFRHTVNPPVPLSSRTIYSPLMLRSLPRS